jgi:hypothetical protein
MVIVTVQQYIVTFSSITFHEYPFGGFPFATGIWTDADFNTLRALHEDPWESRCVAPCISYLGSW